MFQVEDQPEWLYTDNESNNVALWGPDAENSSKYTKDAFHRYVVRLLIGLVYFNILRYFEVLQRAALTI